jgi:hypothetical protein
MSEQDNNQSPDKAKTEAATLQILWLALLLSLGAHAMIAIFAVKNVTPTMGLSIAQTAFAMMAPSVLKQVPPFSVNVLRWALAESISLFGLILRFLGGSLNTFFLFLGWSALLFLVLRPNQDIQK